METYKATLQHRLWLHIIGAGFCAALLLLHVLDIVNISNHRYVYEFQAGLATAFLLLSSIHICKIKKCLQDEQCLYKQMMMEQDERMQMIRDKTGGRYAMTTSLLIIFAGIIAGYFHELVFLTLVSTGTFLLLVRLFLKAYYMHKY